MALGVEQNQERGNLRGADQAKASVNEQRDQTPNSSQHHVQNDQNSKYAKHTASELRVRMPY